MGKAIKYYPKIQVAEFQMDALQLKEGESILITGKTTGVIETEMGKMRVDNNDVSEVNKGDRITFELSDVVRPGDKLYKVVDA